FEVAHPFTADLGARHFDAAAFTDDALEADALVFTAIALPVPGRPEDLFAEKTVLFGLQRAVVDCVGFLHFTVRPLTDLIGRRQADTQLVKEVDVEHVSPSLLG